MFSLSIIAFSFHPSSLLAITTFTIRWRARFCQPSTQDTLRFIPNLGIPISVWGWSCMEDAQKVCNNNLVIIQCRTIAVPGRSLPWQPRISGHIFPGIRVYSASSWDRMKEPLEIGKAKEVGWQFVLGSMPLLMPAICGLNLLVLYPCYERFFTRVLPVSYRLITDAQHQFGTADAPYGSFCRLTTHRCIS